VVTTPSETVAEGTKAYGLACTAICTLETHPDNRATVTPNTKYSFRFSMHYSGQDQVAGMIWYDFAGNIVKRSTNTFTLPVAGPGGWGSHTLTATSPANATAVSAYFSFKSGFVEVDDFYISRNLPPVVTPPLSRAVLVGDTITLTATATDPDNEPLSFSWTQVGGPATLSISDGNTLTPTISGFNAATNYTLLLSVSDGANIITNRVALRALNPAGNLIWLNPGFELSGGEYPAGAGTETTDGWTMWWQLADSGQHQVLPMNNAWPSEPAQQGSFGWGVSATGPFTLETLPTNRAPVTVGELYTLSWWMKYTMRYQVFGIRWYNALGRLVGASTNEFYANAFGGSFEQFFLNAVAPTGAATAAAYFYGGGDTTWSEGQGKYVPGYVELDNFSLRTNNPPVVDAGSSQSDVVSNYTLAASATSPDGAPLLYSWIQQSGPGVAEFADPTSPTGTVTLSTPGIYILRLTVGDGIYNLSDTVDINYLGDYYGNLLGNNYSFEDPNTPIYIESFGQPDYSMPGWIVDFSVATVNPEFGNNVGTMGITDGNGPGTSGSQALYLDCYAGGYVALETAPSARARIFEPGEVYELRFAQSAVPNNAAAGLIWYDALGGILGTNTFSPTGTGYPNFVPTSAKFVAPTNAAWAGITYYMDGGFGMVDNFSILRQTNNEPPSVYAGVEMTRVQGSPIVLAGQATDGDPLDVLNVSWAQVSGPGTVTFGDTNSARTAASFSTNGNYVLRLTVDDQSGLPGHIVQDEVLVHVVPPTGEKVLVFCGQSNMEGNGTRNTTLPPEYAGVLTNVFGFYANEMDVIGGAPETQGEAVYDHLATWSSMKTNIFYGGVTGRYFVAGGTYQPYAYWLGSWTGYSRTSPTDPARQPYSIVKGTTDLANWATGLNPGEPWANANTFQTGETMREYGPELLAMHTIATNLPGENFWVVKYAPGGTSLAGDWNPNRTDGRYVGMKGWVEAALAERPGAEVAGFFWLQGESDCGNGNDYYRNLTNLIARVRADFAVTNMPVIIAKIHPGNTQSSGTNPSTWTNSNYGVVWYGSTNGISNVRAAQGAAATNLPGVKTIETSDLGPLLTKEWHQAVVHDRALTGLVRNAAVYYDVVTNQGWAPVHFNATDIRTIGTRMGRAWLGQPYSATVLDLSSSAAYAPIGLPITYTATLRFDGQTAADATGSVVFTADGQPFSTNALVGGVATSIALTNLPLGVTTIAARFAGDAKYMESSDSLTQQMVGHAIDYYVDPAGNDGNSGTNWAQAFQTIGRAVSAVTPGGTIYLKAGASFTEAVIITNGGIKGYPVTLRGQNPTNRPTINQVAGYDGIYIKDTGYVTMEHLVLTGLGTNINLWNNDVHVGNVTPPCGVHARALEGRYGGIIVSNLTVTKFWRGIQIAGELIPPSHGYGFFDCKILNSQFNHNTDAGGIAFGVYDSPPCMSNMVVRDCQFAYNKGDWIRAQNSGSGFVFGQTIDGLIEHCVAHDNGGMGFFHGGPVGLWCYDSRRITIQYCESFRNWAQQQDGDGFDFDVGTFDSVLQYCYSHDNFGAAVLIEPWDIATSNIVVRYCISENDGLGGLMGSINFMALPTHGKWLTDVKIYNNVIFSGHAPVIYNYDLSLAKDIVFYNNIFVVTNNQPFFNYTGTPEGPTIDQMRFERNVYWTSGGPFNFGGYTSMDEWRQATGNETVNGTNTALEIDPMLVNPGGGGSISNTYELVNMTAYRLKTNSPLINAGYDLASLGIDPGTRDFFGVAVPQEGGTDIGASEFLTTAGYDLYVQQIPDDGMRGVADDPDADGYPNLLEYATGGNPTNADEVASLAVARTNGFLWLRFTRDANATDVKLIVEGAYSITNNTPWAGIATNAEGLWSGSVPVIETGGNPRDVAVQDSVANATNRYMRLNVTRP
jgi:hypothetical protein